MRSPIDSYLAELHARFAEDRSGEVATYIPELGLADPEWFGICLATTDGRVYEVGDTRRAFTIQSMSKPFTYGLALQDNGVEAVAAKVDVEPSGDAFNSISLEPGTGRPRNPMINAGAIATASLVHGASSEECSTRILDVYSRYAGRSLSVDAAVFESERETGHRNRALGHMLRTFEILKEAPDVALEAYFRQCAIAVDCRDIALMGATLANGGRNPVSGERALDGRLVERVLSVMVTCGMYDGSGRWVDAVGLPAKSGVGGGIFAVLPGQLSIGVFSPPLDAQGNSVRGVGVCRAIAQDLQLHSLRVARSARSTIRAHYDIASVRSRRHRADVQVKALERLGTRAIVLELQGDLQLAGSERVVRTVVDRGGEFDIVVVDLRAVDRLEQSAELMLARLGGELRAAGKQFALVQSGKLPDETESAAGPLNGEIPWFGSIDEAREWSEELLLQDVGLSDAGVGDVELAAHGLCAGLGDTELADLSQLLHERRAVVGEAIIRAGDPAAEIFLLLAGEVEVSIALDDGGRRRLATLPPGTTFGELAVLGEGMRTADVTATRESRIMVLDAAAFERLADTNPRLQAGLLRNMLASAYDSVARMTRELSALSSGS